MATPSPLLAQQRFSLSLAHLILALADHNYDVTMGECWRSDETAKLYEAEGKGISNSLHRIRLAVDLNLFLNGRFLTTKEEYRLAGELWKSMSTVQYPHKWGGDFQKEIKTEKGETKKVPAPDANHFSIGWGGVS